MSISCGALRSCHFPTVGPRSGWLLVSLLSAVEKLFWSSVSPPASVVSVRSCCLLCTCWTITASSLFQRENQTQSYTHINQSIIQELFHDKSVWSVQEIWLLSFISPFFCSSGSSGEAHSSQPVEAKFANFLGILAVAFGFVVFGILSRNSWQRPETDESVYVSMNIHHWLSWEMLLCFLKGCCTYWMLCFMNYCCLFLETLLCFDPQGQHRFPPPATQYFLNNWIKTYCFIHSY